MWKYISFDRYCLTPQALIFISASNMGVKRGSSDKLRLRKRSLYDKLPVKNATSSFWCFHCSNFKMTFQKPFWEIWAAIINFFQISNMSNFQYVNIVKFPKFLKKDIFFENFFCLLGYLIFAVSRICINGMATLWLEIKGRQIFRHLIMFYYVA